MSETQAGQPAPPMPPGWYPRADMPGAVGYWDGSRWTEHVAPAAPQMPAAQQQDNNGLVSGGLVLAILLPIVGAIIGIILMARSDNRGLLVLLASVVAGIVWYNIFSAGQPTYGY